MVRTGGAMVRGRLRELASGNKAVASPTLNRLGAQVGRTVVASVVRRSRRAGRAATPRVDEALRHLEQEGWAQVPDLLAPDDLRRVQEAAARCAASDMAFDRIDNGGVQVEIRWRSDVPAELRADLDRFFAHPEVLELGGRAERLELAPGAGRCTLQHLRQVDARPDAEAEIHTDTFQPTHKLWLYLTDVAPEDGPLCYYPRSHRLRWRSLVGTYRESIGANEGSRRVPDRELARSRPGARTFPVRAGTLVIADTHGYHGRAQGSPPGARVALSIELRPHPFRRPAALAPDASGARVGAGAPG